MPFLILLRVSFAFWQLEASLAIVILAATTAGLLLGALVSWARVVRRWRHGPAEPVQEPATSGHDWSATSGASRGASGRR